MVLGYSQDFVVSTYHLSHLSVVDVYSQLPSTRRVTASTSLRLLEVTFTLCGFNESEDSPNRLLKCLELPLGTVTFVP